MRYKKNQVTGQFGSRVPDDAVVLDAPLDNGPDEHWLSGDAGKRARFRELARQNQEKKKRAQFSKAEPEKRKYWRKLTKYEERLDLDDIDMQLAIIADEANNKLRNILRLAERRAVSQITELITHGLTPRGIAVFRLDMGNQFSSTFRDFLLEAWREGIDDGFEELPDEIQSSLRMLRAFEVEQKPHEFALVQELHVYKIVQRGERWCVTTEDGSRTLGCHDTREEALAQLRAVEANKKYHTPGGHDHDQSTHGNWATSDATDSGAFKKWFEGSKVVDSNGKPLVVYHGTENEFDEFKTPLFDEKGNRVYREGDGVFYFSTRPDYWERVSGDLLSRRKYNMMVYLSIQNPAVLTRTQIDALMFGAKPEKFPKDAAFLRQLKEAGHDGAVSDDGVEWVAFSPTQIKSKFNKGTFNPKDPRISYAKNYHTPGGQEHDQDTHGNWADGGDADKAEPKERALEVYLTPNDVEPYDAPGGRPAFTLKGQRGSYWNGKILTPDEIPETIYHVTTAKDAVEKTGYLLGQNNGGGMGGGNGLAGVSLTTSKETAEFIEREMKRSATLAQTVKTRDDFLNLLNHFVNQDSLIADREPEAVKALFRAMENTIDNFDGNLPAYIRLREEGSEFAKGDPYATLAAETYSTVYLNSRSDLAWKAATASGELDKSVYNVHPLRNPLLMGGTEARMRMKPEQVSIIEVKRDMLPKNALVRTGTDDFLQEIRVHADIPLREGVRTKRHGDGQYFVAYHLADTEHDHDQSTHGNWAEGDRSSLTLAENAPPKDKPIVLVFGGSFNPPHMGHIRAAQHAVELMRKAGYDIDRAIFAPTADKLVQKKLGAGALSLDERVELVRLSAQGTDFEVSGEPAREAEKIEGKLRRTQLADWAQRKYPGVRVVNVTGEDQASGVGHDRYPGGTALYTGTEHHAGYHYLALARPQGALSSTKIRQMLAEGKDIPPDTMHPDAVKRLKKT